jgi:hypothetical protein
MIGRFAPMSNLAAVVTITASLLQSQDSNAEILISYPLDNSWIIQFPILPSQGAALAFQVSTQSYSLASVTVNLDAYYPGELKATLCNYTGYGPGDSIAEFNTPAIGQYGRTNYVLTPRGPITLEANTKYWLLLQTTNMDASMGWFGTGPYTGTGASFIGAGVLAAAGWWYPDSHNPGPSIRIEGLPIGTAPNLEIKTAIELRWPTLVGKTYQVQWTASATDTNWANLGDSISGDGLPQSILQSANAQKRFYRILSY